MLVTKKVLLTASVAAGQRVCSTECYNMKNLIVSVEDKYMSKSAEEILYKISDVEKIIGVSRKALQEYDKMDLIHPTKKTEAGYWLYDEDALMTVNVIQMFSMVGYSRKEIKEFLPTVTGFDHLEERKERFQEAIKRLEEKKVQIDGLISMARNMSVVCDMPQEVLQNIHDYKMGGIFWEKSNREEMQKQMDYYSKQDEQVQDQMNQVMLVMMPYIGRLMELSCYQEEGSNSDLVQEKVAELFEEFKKSITALAQVTGQCPQEETIEEAPLSEQLAIFRSFSEQMLVMVQPPAEESMETTLNRRYGEGTGDRIREMLDAFVALKSESGQ